VDTWKVSIDGPLAPYAPGFRVALARLGYASRSALTLIGLMGELSCWLEGRRLDASELTPETVVDFVRTRDATGWFRPTTRTLQSLLAFLRGLGAAPEPVRPLPRTALDEVIERYRVYLVSERGLAATR